MTEFSLATSISNGPFPQQQGAATPTIASPAVAWLNSLHMTHEQALTIALVALSAATLVSVATAFYLYRWRRLILEKPYLLSPEHLASQVLSLEQRIVEHKQSQERDIAKLESASGETRAAMERMIQTYMALQPKIDERDEELRKLRAGFEASLFKRFAKRFIRADLSLNERIRCGSTGPDSLIALGALLADALAECGIERFDPPLGSDYRRAEGVADNPELIPTTDESQAFQIAKIRRAGYRFVDGTGDRVVVPAEVAVFEFTHQTGAAAGGE